MRGMGGVNGCRVSWANVANWRGGTWLCRVASCT
jgi:hypothetical protein